MNSNVKIALALGAVVLAVAGITIISSYSDTDKPADAKGGGVPVAAVIEPVRCTLTQIIYNPQSEHRVQREFPGFFEVNDQEHSADFWFQNVNAEAVEVAALKRSCSACTSARLAVFPARPIPAETELRGQAILGVAGSQTLAPADLEHRLRNYPSADWKLLDFDHPETIQSIPAGSEDAPTWVALRIYFKVKQKGVKVLQATLGFKVPGQNLPVSTDFNIGFLGMSRVEVTPLQLDFQEMAESTASKTEEIIYWSTTVPQGELPPPQCTELASEPFLTFTKPQPLSENEIGLLSAKLSKPEMPFRILGAYKVQVTLHRKNPKSATPPELDIGPLEKSFAVLSGAAGVAESPPVVKLKANVTGLISLTQGGSVDLGTFSSREGIVKPFSLRSDRLDLDLKVDQERTSPKVLKAELEGPTTEDGRRYWTLKISIAAGATARALPDDSAVVLVVSGTGQLVRLPVKGQASLAR